MRQKSERPEIGSRPFPDCYLCGTPGQPLYQGLQDHLFGAPGRWNLKQCPDPTCGLAWLDPIPMEGEIGKAYDTYHTHAQPRQRTGRIYQAYRYARRGYWVNRFGGNTTHSLWQKLAGALFHLHPRYRQSLDLAILELKTQPGKRLLDLGCGRGDMLELFQSLGWQAEGVEMDPKSVGEAQTRGLQVRQGTLADQRYPDKYFQAITMSHVLEHVHDPLTLLRECHRILAPGGRLAITTPNLASRLHRKFLRNWRGLEPPRHLWLFSPACLRAIVREAGFGNLSLATRARGAQFFYLESLRIANQRSSTGSRRERFRASSFFWLEWAGLWFWPDSGEELLLHGQKTMGGSSFQS